MNTKAKSILCAANLLWAIGVVGLAGCGAASVRGHRVRTFFSLQRAPVARVPGSAEGLDSEEAALIHARYRSSLGPAQGSSSSRPSDVIIVEEHSNGTRR